MSELPLPEQTLETYQLHGRSLNDWHRYLTTEARSGIDHGDLETPGSRYGRRASECAYFAIAAELAFVAGVGESDERDAEPAFDWLMALAVNGHSDVGRLILEYWDAMPDCLKERLGDREDVQQLVTGEQS